MTYLGAPGAPADPAVAGPYCLALCRCTTCPQYPEQARRAAVLREQEYAARDRDQGARTARRAHTTGRNHRPGPDTPGGDA